MRLYNIHGKLQSKNVNRFLIKWGGKSRSLLQKEVKKFFKTYWKNQVVYEEFPVYGTRMKVDFVNATKKIAVEVNGPQHSSFNKFFHNNSRMNYLESIKRDCKKRKWLEENNFKILEIEEKDIKKLSPEFIENTFGISII